MHLAHRPGPKAGSASLQNHAVPITQAAKELRLLIRKRRKTHVYCYKESRRFSRREVLRELQAASGLDSRHFGHGYGALAIIRDA